jgi:hypothetical protein
VVDPDAAGFGDSGKQKVGTHSHGWFEAKQKHK